jgi:hypothetical protein
MEESKLISNYPQILEELKITKITKLSQIDEIINISSLSREDPEIFIDTDAIIIFDNPDYNSAYILDEYAAFFELSKSLETISQLIQPKLDVEASVFEAAKKLIFDKVSTVINRCKVFYCEDEELHSALFEPFFQTGQNSQTQTSNPPALIMISPVEQIVFIDMEGLYPIGVEKIIMAHLMLHDASEAKEQITIEEKRKIKVAEDTNIN